MANIFVPRLFMEHSPYQEKKKNLTLVCALKILFLVVEGNKILIP